MRSLTLSDTLKIALGTFFLLFAVLPSTSHASLVGGVETDLSILLATDVPTSGGVYQDQNGYDWFSVNYGSFVIATNTKQYVLNTDIHGKFVVITDNILGSQSGHRFRAYFQDDLGFKQYREWVSACTDCTINTPFSDASGWYKQVFDFGSATTAPQLPTGNWRITQVQVAGSYPPKPYMGAWFVTDNGADFIDTASEAYQYVDTINGSFVEPETRITTIINPLSGSLQSSTTVTFNFDYYFNDVDYGDITHITAIVTDLSMGTTVPMVAQEILSSGNGNYTATTTLTQGHLYMWQPKMYGATSTILGNFQTFDVVTYSGQASFLPPSSTSTIGELTLECGDGIITGSICNLIGYLFVPSSDVLNRFSTLWDNVKTKKPFGYVTVTIQSLSDLDTSGTQAFDLGTVPFQDSIFTPFKIALGSILWALYAIYFYQRRLKHLDI